MVYPLNDEYNPICHFLALLRDNPVLHVSSIRVNVNQQHDLLSINKNSTDSVHTVITYGYCFVLIVEVEKQ
jgi:hypothetical protein